MAVLSGGIGEQAPEGSPTRCPLHGFDDQVNDAGQVVGCLAPGPPGQAPLERQGAAGRHQRHPRSGQHFQPAWSPVRYPGLVGGKVARLGCGVEQGRHQFGPPVGVDGREVNLGVQRELTTGEPVDQVQLPQGPGAVQRSGVQPGHQLGDGFLPTGRWHRDLPHVEVEVKGGVRHPVGPVQPERHRCQAPAQPGHQLQAFRHELLHRGKGQRSLWPGLEYRDPADISGRGGCLGGQVAGVDGAQLFQRLAIPLHPIRAAQVRLPATIRGSPGRV